MTFPDTGEATAHDIETLGETVRAGEGKFRD
jgi:hypothetical protein